MPFYRCDPLGYLSTVKSVMNTNRTAVVPMCKKPVATATFRSAGRTVSEATGLMTSRLSLTGPGRDGVGLVAGEHVDREVPMLIRCLGEDVSATEETLYGYVDGFAYVGGNG